MKKTLISAIALLFLSVPVLAEPEQWSGFRGPNGQGISTVTDVPIQWSATENIAWKTPIPGEGWSSPVIWNDHIFLTSATERGTECRVIAIDRKSGDILWNKMVFTQVPGRHNPRNSHASPTPVTDGQRVYAVFPNGHFVALDFAGNIVWTNTDFDFYSCHGFASSPILYGDLLITAVNPSDVHGARAEGGGVVGHQVPWDKSFLWALDKNTGEERWRGLRGMSSISSSSPVVIQVDGKDQILSMVGDVTQGFEPATGELIWTVRSGGQPAVPSPAVGDGMVFASPILGIRTNGRGNVTDTHIAWRQGRNSPSIASFLYVNSVLYTAGGNGTFAAIDPANGNILWEHRLQGGSPDSSPIYADGKIYVTTSEGITTVLRPNAVPGTPAEVVAVNDIGARVQATRAGAGKQSFLRTETELWCIGK